MKTTRMVSVGLVGVLALAGIGCAASFEGSGSKDAASAEQLALRLDDPWDAPIVKTADRAAGDLKDGIYTGVGLGTDGLVTVTISVKDNVITVLETAQEGETQSVGGYEAIRDGKYAAMIEAAQGSDIDTISGATFTTAAIRRAVEDALEQASAGQADPSKESAHIKAEASEQPEESEATEEDAQTETAEGGDLS